MLNEHPDLLKATKFVGQSQGKQEEDKGFNQKEQKRVGATAEHSLNGRPSRSLRRASSIFLCLRQLARKDWTSEKLILWSSTICRSSQLSL